MLCIQKGGLSPLSLHSAASDISEDKIGVVYSKGTIIPLSLHITASDISQG